MMVHTKTGTEATFRLSDNIVVVDDVAVGVAFIVKGQHVAESTIDPEVRKHCNTKREAIAFLIQAAGYVVSGD